MIKVEDFENRANPYRKETQSMSRDEIIEQTAQVLSTLTTCDGQPHASELHHSQARALADAGLLARPLPTRDQVEGDRHMSDCATEWVDGRGRSRWQPITPDGERLYHVSDYINGSHRVWRTQNEGGRTLFPTLHDPVIYRSRARAERVARRRQARQTAKALRRMHPVQKKETE